VSLTRQPVRRLHDTTFAAPRVGLFGLLGQGNLGNDASLETVLTYLRVKHPDAILDCMCSEPDRVEDSYGIPASRLWWYEPGRYGDSRVMTVLAKCLGKGVDTWRTFSWVRRHDAVIVPGMGVLETSLPIKPLQTPYSLFLLCISGRLSGTKVALVSVGASVINQRFTRWLTVTAARLAHYRSYRDVSARNAMQKMGVDVSGDGVYPDLVFSFPTPRESPAHAGCDGTQGGVGVGIMDYRGSNDDRTESDTIRQAYVSGMQEFVLWLLDNGRTVRVFGGDTADDTFVRDFVADVLTSRPGLDSSHLAAVPAPTFRDLMQHMAAFDIVVATRFHNVLCALKLAKPTIAISYGSKHDALMHNMGLAAYCHPAKSVRADQLVRQFTDLEHQSAEIREMLTQRSAASTRLADSQFAELSSALFSENDGVSVG